MTTRFYNSFLAYGALIALLLTGCISPRPQSFTDAETLPSDFVGKKYRAVSKGNRLIVEVSPSPGLNVVGLDAFEQGGALYVSPRRISSDGGSTNQLAVDVSKFQLGADWTEHVYWLVESSAYPIYNAGFWSSDKRSPWVRKKMEIVRQ